MIIVVFIILTSITRINSQTITGLDNTSYTEGSAPVYIDQSVGVSGSYGYGGGFLLFDINGSPGDYLNLVSDANPNANGAISVSSGNLYKGNGTGTDLIGSIDNTKNGQNGNDLQINFTSYFSNSSFESGIGGWAIGLQWVDLGVTSIAGYISPEDYIWPSSAGGDAEEPYVATYDY